MVKSKGKKGAYGVPVSIGVRLAYRWRGKKYHFGGG
jgi:hypothetical protein